MINVNKSLYIALAIICTVFAVGVVLSKIIAGQTFDFASDGMLLLTTVAGWLFAKQPSSTKSEVDKTKTEEEEKKDEKPDDDSNDGE